MLHDTNTPLDPPSAPFASSMHSQPTASHSSSSSLRKGSGLGDSEASSVSLSVNYLPKKFSSTLLAAGPRRRKGGKPAVPKIGGGVEAFRSGEARMSGLNDDDYDGVSGGLFDADGAPRKLRWNRFKWTLFTANCFVSDSTH